MPLIILMIGLILLLLGAWGVVTTALKIADKARISPLIVGITAVAIGTSLPELTVSLLGGIDGATNLALGDIIGSNIANIGLIFAVSILINSTKVGTHKTQNNIYLYFGLTLIISFLLYTNNLNIITGFILIIVGFLTLLWQIQQGKSDSTIADKELITHNEKEIHPYFMIGSFLASLIALILGGKLIVDYGVVLANQLNISETLVGITAIAIGTSLPELAVSLIGLYKHQTKLVVGNILGSNIFNLLLGGGILGMYNVGILDNTLTLISFIIFSFLLTGCLYFYRGRFIPRLFGFIFLSLYIIYLSLLLI
ncbi:MAG: calcium/sodium antiporter [Patescibacteria group bacterium]